MVTDIVFLNGTAVRTYARAMVLVDVNVLSCNMVNRSGTLIESEPMPKLLVSL